MEDYVFYATTAQGGVIRSMFETLKDVVHDVSFLIEEEGVRLLMMDGLKSLLIWLRLYAKEFERFDLTGGPYRLGVNMSDLFDVLKLAAARDTVSLYMERARPERLGIKISSAEHRATTVVSMVLQDINFRELSVPDVKFDGTVTMPAQYFQRLCRNLSNIGKLMEITLAGDGSHVKLACVGGSTTHETVVYPCKDQPKHVVTIERHGDDARDIAGTYSLKQLSQYSKSSSNSGVVELYFRHDYPLILRFAVASLGELRFALTPHKPQ